MAAVDTCNRALSEIGTQSTISSLTDGSNEAVQCSLWYDNQRQGLLRSAQWGFARKQVVLTLLGTQQDLTAPYPYLFKYAYPSDCLKVRYLLAPPYNGTAVPPQVSVGQPSAVCWTPSRANRFLVASDLDTHGNTIKVILSNVCAAIGVYTADITDTDMFDPMFESALCASLAYKLVIPLSGNSGMRQTFRESAEGSIMNARAADGNEAIPTSDAQTDWIAARGGGYGYGYGGGIADSWGQCWGGYDSMGWGA